jgi:flagellar biosynthetic protein FlhB
MATDANQSRTEAPTPRRREEARQKGQVARSGDLSSGLVLLAGVAVLWFAGDSIGQSFVESMRSTLGSFSHVDLTIDDAALLTASLFGNVCRLSGSLLAATFFVGLVVGVIQVGFQLTTQTLAPDWDRISPGKGWSRMLSQHAAMRGIISVLKVSAFIVLIAWFLGGQVKHVATAGHGTLLLVIATAWDVIIHAALMIAGAVVVLGLVDYIFQRWKHEEELKMSRQDLKDEQKRDEGDPQIRARVKKIRHDMLLRQMLREVPKATVVLTNPTHIAVAIRYDRATMAAPVVIAKGKALVAKRITTIARQHRIPVLERKPLARALYAAVEVGQAIPVSLYRAVAEILAYIYGLRPTGSAS